MILKVPIYIEVDVKFQEYNGELVKFLSEAFTKRVQRSKTYKHLNWNVEPGSIPGVPKDLEIPYDLLLYKEVIEKMRKG